MSLRTPPLSSPWMVDSILINVGTDYTEEFDAIHSDKAKAMLEDYRMGELIHTSDADLPQLSIIKEVAMMRSSALIPGEKIPCKLVSKTSISSDNHLFRFTLPSSDHVLGLPVGKHIFLSATIDNKLCMRAYMPTSSVDQVGYFDLLIKIYFKGSFALFDNLSGLLVWNSNTSNLGVQTANFHGFWVGSGLGEPVIFASRSGFAH